MSCPALTGPKLALCQRVRAVHRLIEQRVAINGDAIAIVDGTRSCSYRELNSAANAFARRLMTNGFRRGMRADVRMAPAVDLAIILLAVLKAGGCYTWRNDDPPSLAITTNSGEPPMAVMNGTRVDDVCGGPNLPILTRETDIACVLDGSVAVPHATIVTMAAYAAMGQSPWSGEQGAFDLWAALLSGAAAVVTAQPSTYALPPSRYVRLRAPRFGVTSA